MIIIWSVNCGKPKKNLPAFGRIHLKSPSKNHLWVWKSMKTVILQSCDRKIPLVTKHLTWALREGFTCPPPYDMSYWSDHACVSYVQGSDHWSYSPDVMTMETHRPTFLTSPQKVASQRLHVITHPAPITHHPHIYVSNSHCLTYRTPLRPRLLPSVYSPNLVKRPRAKSINASSATPEHARYLDINRFLVSNVKKQRLPSPTCRWLWPQS